MKKHKLNIIVFVAIVYLLSITNIIIHGTDTTLASENRTTSDMPSLTTENLFSGDYFKGIDNYFADTFMFRKNFIDISKKIKSLKGLNNEDEEIVAFGGLNVADDLTNDGPSSEELVKETNFGQILIVDKKAMELNIYNDVAITNYTKAINYIDELVGKDVQTYSILVPTQIEFVEKNKYKDISYSQKECIDTAYNNLDEKVTPIDVYTALKNHSKEYIYFRTDHHWTPLGAYYAYCAFIESKGEEPVALDLYKKSVAPNFLGTLYDVTLKEVLTENPDTVAIFEPYLDHEFWTYPNDQENYMGKAVDIKYMDKKNKYSVYLKGDHPLGKIRTGIKNNKKILLIKDSYANSFIPFLIPHYEEIYFVDPRLYNGNIIDLVKNNDINEVLFLNYVLVNRYDGFSKLFMKISGVQE